MLASASARPPAAAAWRLTGISTAATAMVQGSTHASGPTGARLRPPCLRLHQQYRTFFGLGPKIQIVHINQHNSSQLVKVLKDHITIDELRSKGHLSAMHWRFPGDEPRCSTKVLQFGPNAVSPFPRYDPRYWIRSLQVTMGARPGIELVQEATKPLASYLAERDGQFRDTLVDNLIQPTIEGLSYSPADHGKFLDSHAMTRLYTPTLRARILECADCLQKGGYEFKIAVEHILGAQMENQGVYVMLGDRSTLSSGDLLGPRTVLRQVGPSLMLADLKYDMGSVSVHRQEVTFNDSLPKDKQGMQYLVDIHTIVTGTATITRAPPSPPPPHDQPKPASVQAPPQPAPTLASAPSATKSGGGNKKKKKKGAIAHRVVRLPTPQAPKASAAVIHPRSSGSKKQGEVVVEVPFLRPVVIRLASQVFAPDEYRLAADPDRITWKVADIDYMVTAQLLERQRELAPLLNELA